MAMHEVPADGAKHLPTRDCPCSPAGKRRLVAGVMRTVYVHTAAAPSARDDVDQDDVDESGPGQRVDDECGHVIVDVDGVPQHHEIPDDGAPHAPTSECGCGPQRHTVSGHIVYEHVDQDADPEGDDQDDDRD